MAWPESGQGRRGTSGQVNPERAKASPTTARPLQKPFAHPPGARTARPATGSPGLGLAPGNEHRGLRSRTSAGRSSRRVREAPRGSPGEPGKGCERRPTHSAVSESPARPAPLQSDPPRVGSARPGSSPAAPGTFLTPRGCSCLQPYLRLMLPPRRVLRCERASVAGAAPAQPVTTPQPRSPTDPRSGTPQRRPAKRPIATATAATAAATAAAAATAPPPHTGGAGTWEGGGGGPPGPTTEPQPRGRLNAVSPMFRLRASSSPQPPP